MRSLVGKRALVTGGASGIGRAIAGELARAGAHVWVLDLDEPRLAETLTELRAAGVEASGRRTDLADPDDTSLAVADVLAAWGHIDLLVNNAGIAWYGPVMKMTGTEWERLLRVNLHAPLQLTRELLPVLLARPEAHIVNMASILGLVALPRQTAYATSKHALVAFSESLRAELAGRPVGVTCMCPGWVETPMWDRAGQAGKTARRPPKLIATTPERVARRTIRAIRRDEGLVVMTWAAHLFYGFKRLAPRLMAGLYRVRRRKSAAAADADVHRPNKVPKQRAA
jgi:short-subunit dehydrogenase